MDIQLADGHKIHELATAKDCAQFNIPDSTGNVSKVSLKKCLACSRLPS